MWQQIRESESQRLGGVVFGVSEISQSCETRSTTGQSDLGKHATKIHEFGEK
jgi:hypothetical protein